MTKDFIKFLNAIESDENLTLEEGHMLTVLFKYYNVSCSYAFPSYEVLMAALKTKRRSKVSKILKSLVKKGYIMITKVGKKNTYKLLKYLFLNNKKSSEKKSDATIKNDMPVDSNGNAPLADQIHFSEINNDEKEVMELGFTKEEAKSLLKIAKNKVEKIIKAFKYTVTKKAEDKVGYTIWGINNPDKIEKSFRATDKNNDGEWHPKTKFDNFKPREYDYESLERKLLGWEQIEHIDEEPSTFDLNELLIAI